MGDTGEIIRRIELEPIERPAELDPLTEPAPVTEPAGEPVPA